MTVVLTRRVLLASGLAAATTARAQSQAQPKGRLVFSVWRGGHQIGRHALTFSGDAQNFSVGIEAAMAVSVGPIPVFTYSLKASEIWRAGQFAALASTTVVNGRTSTAQIVRSGAGLTAKSAKGTHVLPPNALPLTHWNERAFAGPIFDPQSGALLRESVRRLPGGRGTAARGYALSGEADITDWYDEGGAWTALRAKVFDGSFIDYRRAA